MHEVSDDMTEPTIESEDTLSLSFLDVLSCGLGATTFLFLLFSVMPHLGATSVSAGSQMGTEKAPITGGNIGMLGPPAKVAAWQVVLELPNSVTTSLVTWRGFPPQSQAFNDPSAGAVRLTRLSTRMPGSRVWVEIDTRMLTAAVVCSIRVVVGATSFKASVKLDPALMESGVISIDPAHNDPTKWISGKGVVP